MIHNGIQMRLAADASEELSSAFPMPLVPSGGGDVGHLHVLLMAAHGRQDLGGERQPMRDLLN